MKIVQTRGVSREIIQFQLTSALSFQLPRDNSEPGNEGTRGKFKSKKVGTFLRNMRKIKIQKGGHIHIFEGTRGKFKSKKVGKFV
jgi:hypothetical protein